MNNENSGRNGDGKNYQEKGCLAPVPLTGACRNRYDPTGRKRYLSPQHLIAERLTNDPRNSSDRKIKGRHMLAIRTSACTRKLPPIRPQVVTQSIAVSALIACTFFVLDPARAENAFRAASATRSAVDLTHKPVPRLEAGIVIGQEKDNGYSDLVTLVLPRLSSGHVDSLPEFARRYASMFKLTVLANVTPQKNGERTLYLLDKIGIGFAMNIKGEMVVVTRATANELGAELGMIDRGVLGGNEDCLEDVIQVARTRRLIVFDAKANMLIGNEHEERIIRHFIWASPASGKLGFLVWQLKENASGQYDIDSPAMQLLPSGYREDRQIHVSDGGWLSSVPTPDRFALVRLPQGTPVPFTEQLKGVAGKKEMTQKDLDQLLSGTSQSLAALTTHQPVATHD
jgi:hypothetical protein